VRQKGNYILSASFGLIALLVMYSRLVLGVHSIDQVLFGASIGLAISDWFHLSLNKQITDHIA
jgi:membrane-associated phospholipid phosphatase